MHLRSLVALAGGCVMLCAAGARSGAQNQAPFTIRRPPDGARVRGKVRIQVPLASIPAGGYVAYSIDGRFRVALAPTAEQRAKAKRGDTFDFVWDTKEPVKEPGQVGERPPADGEHTVSASLYVPRPGAAGGSELKQTSSVRLRVNNRIAESTGPVSLRYRFRDGLRRDYVRTGELKLVGGLSGGGRGAGEVEVSGLRSKLEMSVEDIYSSGDAMLRNRLAQLSLRYGGQETSIPSDQLPGGVYRQVSPLGRVEYQNRSGSLDQFAASGVNVVATVELPVLRSSPVSIGDSWQTPNVSLEIPGMAEADQPKVTVTSKFEGLEWEGGYPTAKIVETYDSTKSALNKKELQVGPYLLTDPQVKFTREVYIAYEYGTLVKVVRRLEVTGKSGAAQGAPVMGGAGMSGGTAPGMSSMMGMSGGMSMPGGLMPGGLMPGGMTAPGGSTAPMPSMGSAGLMPGGMTAPGGSSMPGGLFPGSGRARGGRTSRMGSMAGASSMMGPMGGMRLPGTGSMAGMRGPMTGGTTGPTQLTLRATTVTEIAPNVAQERGGRPGS